MVCPLPRMRYSRSWKGKTPSYLSGRDADRKKAGSVRHELESIMKKKKSPASSLSPRDGSARERKEGMAIGASTLILHLSGYHADRGRENKKKKSAATIDSLNR